MAAGYAGGYTHGYLSVGLVVVTPVYGVEFTWRERSAVTWAESPSISWREPAPITGGS